MDSQKPPRRPCFIEEDDGLASVAEMKAGLSGCNQNISRPQIHYSASAMQRKNSLRNLNNGFNSGYVSSPRPVNATMRFYEEPLQPHFLEACFLCKKQLGCNKDIFMYRGDTPFCSEECRQEQIQVDEEREKSLNLSASMRAMRKEQRKSNSSPNKTATDCSYRSSTVAAA